MGSPNYLAVASAFHGHHSTKWWLALGDLLGGRPGWRCELTDEGLIWLFGPLGTGLFVVSAPFHEDPADVDADYENGRYVILDHAADEMPEFTGTEKMREWLDANESRHAKHVEKLRFAYEENDWAVLKSMEFETRITHDGHTFIATVPYLSMESTFADDLPTVLTRVQELIAHAFDAPQNIAPEITVKARLDPAAVNAVTTV